MDVTAGATVVLVLITAYYAWQTHALTEEARRARELAMLPVLVCAMTAHPPTGKKVDGAHGDVHGEFNTLSLRNVGSGPALDVRVSIETLNAERSTLVLGKTTLSLGSLGIEAREIDLAPATHRLYGSEDSVVHIDARYKNLYGRQVSTKVTMVMEPGNPIASNWQWRNQDEKVEAPR